MEGASAGRNAIEHAERASRDLRLIESYRSGSGAAFDQLVHEYEGHVKRILARLSASPGDADDLTQEVFLRIFRNLRHFRGQSSFYTWLYRITVNVYFDDTKKRKRADLRLARLQETLADAAAPPAGNDPYRACRDALVRREFERAISALPEAFRAIVSLREMHDLSYEEIAAATGISVGTVRSRLSRARTRLRTLMRATLVETAA